MIWWWNSVYPKAFESSYNLKLETVNIQALGECGDIQQLKA